MSNLVTKRVQYGSSTAVNNFVIQQPDTPNGTLQIANGNIGSASAVLTLSSSGALTITGALSTTSVAATTVAATTVTASSTMTVGGTAVLTAVNAPYLGTNSIIRTNANVISASVTIPSNTNGLTVGPVQIASGVIVTVNGDWSVV
jgi:hypothetical protein